MGTHLIDGEFQSDKYPTTPRGKVPLSTKDPTAQDLLWQYAQRRRSVDAEFADDLEWALTKHGYVYSPDLPGTRVTPTDEMIEAFCAKIAPLDDCDWGAKKYIRDVLAHFTAPARVEPTDEAIVSPPKATDSGDGR